MKSKIVVLLLLVSFLSYSKLVVVGDENFPPFEWVNEQGEYVGFNVDLMKAVASELNESVEFRPMKWVDAVESVKNGSADIIQGIKYSEERSKFLDFAKPSLTSSSAIFVKKEDYTIHSVSSLVGKKVSVQKADYSHNILSNVSGIELLLFDDYEQALRALEEGKVDAFMGGKYAALYFIKKDNLKDLKIAKDDIDPKPYGIAVKQGNTALLDKVNSALVRIEERGAKKALFEKWFGEEINNYPDITRILSIWLTIFVVSFVLFNFFYYGWTKSLEKKVKERTKELEYSRQELLVTMKELEKAFEKLKEKDRERDEFIRTVSHELKTPVTIMQLNLDLLTGYSKKYKGKEKQVINRIRRATVRLDKTIKDILEFERARKARLSRKVKVKEAIRESISEVIPLAEAKKLKIKRKISGSPIARMSKEDLVRVLVNLLSNAVKFDDKGPIEVSAVVVDGEVLISVKDHGVGLSKEELGKVFTPFFKASPEKPGTGIGLSVAKKIVKLYGGRIWAESKGKNKGAVFRFTVPKA